MKKTRKNLQPWLDYFKLLAIYKENGFLQMNPNKHEAFITKPALLTLAEDEKTAVQDKRFAVASGTLSVARRIRIYACWLSFEGISYIDRPFALNVVKPDFPHDVLYTLLLTRRRRWWRFFMKADAVEIITYDDKKR